jgi:hypothetical protein
MTSSFISCVLKSQKEINWRQSALGVSASFFWGLKVLRSEDVDNGLGCGSLRFSGWLLATLFRQPDDHARTPTVRTQKAAIGFFPLLKLVPMYQPITINSNVYFTYQVLK